MFVLRGFLVVWLCRIFRFSGATKFWLWHAGSNGPLPVLREREGKSRLQIVHSAPVGGNKYRDMGGRGGLFCENFIFFSVFP